MRSFAIWITLTYWFIGINYRREVGATQNLQQSTTSTKYKVQTQHKYPQILLPFTIFHCYTVHSLASISNKNYSEHSKFNTVLVVFHCISDPHILIVHFCLVNNVYIHTIIVNNWWHRTESRATEAVNIPFSLHRTNKKSAARSFTSVIGLVNNLHNLQWHKHIKWHAVQKDDQKTMFWF